MGCSFLCSSDFCSTLLQHKSLISLGRNLRTLPAQKTRCGNPPEIDIRIEICHVPRPNASGQTPEGDEESGIEPMKEPPRSYEYFMKWFMGFRSAQAQRRDWPP